MSDFKQRVRYLQNKNWANKPLLPFNEKQFPLVPVPDTGIVYDFEAQNNIYSIAAFYEQEHKLIIWYKASPDLKRQIDPKIVEQKAYEINGLTLKTYPKALNEDTKDSKTGKRYINPIKIEVKELTFDALRQIFERPKRYVVGFNSNYYDLPLAAYILAYSYHNQGASGDPLPTPDNVRKFSNLLINPMQTILENQDRYNAALVANNIHLGGKHTRLSIWDLDKIFEPETPEIVRRYPNGQSNPNQGTAPALYQTYERLLNTGLHLDIKLLNEKDKDDQDSKYTSLKRISAQLGYQIEEPESVNLSSNGNLNLQQAINLLAYNASDVLVTTLIYHTKEPYQNVLGTREGLLNRFDESNFGGKLNVNSTSAQFVEKVIAPDHKLVDQPTINFFYPVHDDAYEDFQAKIDQDFVNKDVKLTNTAILQSKFNEWLHTQHPEIFSQIQQNYQENVKLAQINYRDTQSSHNFQVSMQQAGIDKQNNSGRIVQSLMGNFNDPHDYYYDFLKDFIKNSNKGINEREYLDEKWTREIQKDPRFAPKKGRDGKIHQRFRVKYGQIQEDLLEHMANTYKKFPDAVYNLYSYFRNTKSKYINGELVPASEVAVKNFIDHYLPILGREKPTTAQIKKGQKGKPIAPKDVFYKFRQGTTDVTGIGVIVQVPGRPMCLSFSIGGVHGEVMNADKYERDKKLEEKYNKLLWAIKLAYDAEHNDQAATEFYNDTINHKLPPKLAKYFNSDDQTLKKDVLLFVTKHKNGNFTFKNKKKRTNPKSYVIPIDMHNAVHVDVDSLYPSLMINLHLFSTWTTAYNDPANFDKTNKRGHWDDIYAKLRAERIRLKKAANSVPKEQWGPLQYHQWAIQLINKLLLNSASGIADGKWDTNVRVNNRAVSMRIMGQLALTYLVYSVEPRGVYSTSTNTDGVYLTSNDPSFNEKSINKEIEHWKHYFHLGATPEIMSHFVSKDSNNRFEQENSKTSGNPAGGTIGNAFGSNPKSKMSQPFVIDAGIVNYFKTHTNVCKTYNIPMDDLKKYLLKQQSIIVNATEYTPEVRKAMLSFCWPIQPHKHQNYCLANKEQNATEFLAMQHVNRIILVKHGYYLRGYEIQKLKKTKKPDEGLTNWCVASHKIDDTSPNVAYRIKVSNFNPNWQALRVNLDLRAYFKSPIWQTLDIDAYAQFTRDRILGDKSSRIWVEPEFPVPKYQDKVENLINDNALKINQLTNSLTDETDENYFKTARNNALN